MGLQGKVAIVTGAGRGLGREHALLLAERGAQVVVNDVGGGTDGSGGDGSVARGVVDEIEALGGVATANGDSVADWDGARRLVESAVETFGRLDVVVNNAGILRDRMLVNMDEADWDAVIGVHLKGTFAVSRFAAAHWRQQAKSGDSAGGAIVNTSSSAGLFNNVGQANYGAAKAAIVALTMISAKELERYGVRVNAIAPGARTRLTLQTPGLGELQGEADGGFDIWDPANVAPLVAYLADDECPFTGTLFHVLAGQIAVFRGWTFTDVIEKDGRWSVDELPAAMKELAGDSGRMLSESDALGQLLGRLDLDMS